MATGQQRGESAEELAWNHGQMRSTPETIAEKIGSSEEDLVKRCRHSSCFVEFSLVTRASVSPHMHVVLHILLLHLVNPTKKKKKKKERKRGGTKRGWGRNVTNGAVDQEKRKPDKKNWN